MGNIKAIGLIRVSTARQADEDHFGPEAQATAIQKIAKQYDLDIVETISYNDVSGADVMYAPEMQHLLRLIQKPEITGVATNEMSRLVRPGFEDWPLLDKFVRANITLYLPSGPLKLSDAHGQFIATIHGAVAAYERHTIKSRMMGGREESRRLGYCASGGMTIPTGWTWDVKTKTWGTDPNYVPKIIEAVHMILNGETNFQYIIDKLQFCLRPGRGAPRLTTPTDLRRLLENRALMGERVIDKKFDLTFPKERLLYTGKDGKVHRRRRPTIPREPHEIFVAQVPPLISRDEFDRLQAILRAKSDKRHQSHALRDHREKFVYRGLLFCGDCGSPMYTQCTSEPYSYYRCRDAFNRPRGKRTCKSVAMKKVKLEAELDRVFSREFTKTQFLARVLKQQSGSENRKRAAQRREFLEGDRKRLTDKRERVIEFALDGIYSKQERDRKLNKIDDDLAANRKALEELAHADARIPTATEWRRLFEPFRKGFTGLPVEEKRRLITSRFQEIKVRDGRVVSLYLLTGDVIIPAPPPPVTTECFRCGSKLDSDEVNARYCERCSDETATKCCDCGSELDSEKVMAGKSHCGRCYDGIPHGGGPIGWVHPGVFDPGPGAGKAFSDTSERFQPRRTIFISVPPLGAVFPISSSV